MAMFVASASSSSMISYGSQTPSKSSSRTSKSVSGSSHVSPTRGTEVGAQWRACRDGIAESLGHIEPTRQTALSTDELEVLLGAVTDVVEPLDVWQDAERHWRSLRTRR
jgi:hypothetical protein